MTNRSTTSAQRVQHAPSNAKKRVHFIQGEVYGARSVADTSIARSRQPARDYDDDWAEAVTSAAPAKA
jgi:hypothetical protein